MKTIIASAILATATFAGAASAMVNSSAAAEYLNQYAPGTDVSELTTAQQNLVITFATSGDGDGEKRAKIQSIVK